MENKQGTPLPPDNADKFAALLESAGAVRKPKAQPAEQVRVEPTMRALRRILGDDVLDIFPEGIIENTDKLYELSSGDSEFWAEIVCETTAERNDLLALMKAYAECAGDKGYTVRQDRTAKPHVLRTRVITRKGSGGNEPDGSE